MGIISELNHLSKTNQRFEKIYFLYDFDFIKHLNYVSLKDNLN